MNNTIKNVLITLLLLCMAVPAKTQHTAVYDDPTASYEAALSLFQKQQYGAAAQAFDKVANYKGNDIDDLMQARASYYAAVCAVELDHDDGGYRVSEFIRQHPGNSLVNKAHYQLGRYRFDKRQYKSALEAFDKVEVPELSPDERTEYYYKKGYCHYQAGEAGRARASFAKVINGNSPYTSHARYYYAVVAFEEGDDATAEQYFELVRNDKSFNKSVATYLTHIYHRRGEYDKMLALAEPAYETSSGKEKPALALMIGDSWYRKGEYGKALPYFEFYERTSRRSMSRETAYQIGYTYYMLEQHKVAIQNFQQVTGEEDELSQNAYYHLGFCYLATEQKKYAAGAFSSAYKLDFDKAISEDALFNYAKLTMEVASDPYNSAIAALEDYIEKYPDAQRAEEAYSYLASLYLSTRNYKQALASMERISTLNPSIREAYQKICYYRGIELFNENKLDEAINLFKTASTETADREIAALAGFWIGEAFYRQDNTWAAIKYFKEFIENKYAKSTPVYSNAYYNLGYAYFNKKDYDNAIRWFGNFIEFRGQKDDGMAGDALVRLGDCYFIRKDYSRAIQYYNNAAKGNTGSTDYALYQKAITQGASGMFTDKAQTLRELIGTLPNSTYADDAKYELAVTFMLLNSNRDALDWFARIVKEHPGSRYAVKAQLKAGLIYYNENRNELALGSLKKVVEDYPNTPEAREALNSIRSIYIDQNRVGEYYAYAEKLGFADVSVSEQDSITYIAAENIYMTNNCTEAIKAFQAYLEKFPYGAFSVNASYYKAECDLKQNNREEALAGFENVAGQPIGAFTENSLLQAARLSMGSGRWEKALEHYMRLQENAEYSSNQAEALEGITDCNVKLERWADAITSAMKLLSSEKVDENRIIKAHYTIASAYMALNQLENAQAEYRITDQLANNALGAESKYMTAYIDFSLGNYTAAENGIFALSDSYGSYDHWVARGFLLLAEVYMATGNSFQAKETLKSIIGNYAGPELGKQAAARLAEIERQEQSVKAEDEEKNN